MRYIKLFEQFNEETFSEEDTINPLENEAILKIENRTKNIYDILGITFKKDLKSDVMDLPEGRKLVKYYRYYFDLNFNKNRTSLLNLMCLFNVLSYDKKSNIDIKQPLNYDSYIYPVMNNGSYISELWVYLTKYHRKKRETFLTVNTEIQNYSTFYEEDPNEIFNIFNDLIYKNITDCSDEIYVRFEGNTNVPNLIECIKQYIQLNNNPNNNEIKIPELFISEIKKSLEQFNSYSLWNEIKINNPILYNKLKSEQTDSATEISDMGFQD